MCDYEVSSDYCDECEMGFYDFIDLLIMNTKHLESKVVSLRYLLSTFFPDYDAKMLRSDIFSDLSPSFYDQPVYQQYISKYYDGNDPMDDDEYCSLMIRLSRGEESVNL